MIGRSGSRGFGRKRPKSPEGEAGSREVASRPSPREHGVALIGRRDWTKASISQRLRSDGYGAEEIADAVEYLAEAGYLDDRRFAQRFLESHRAQSGRGRMWLENEMRSLGVPGSLAREMAAGARDSDEEASEAFRAAEAIKRKEPGIEAGRLAGRLARRGFGSQQIRLAVKQLELGEIEEDAATD